MRRAYAERQYAPLHIGTLFEGPDFLYVVLDVILEIVLEDVLGVILDDAFHVFFLFLIMNEKGRHVFFISRNTETCRCFIECLYSRSRYAP